MRTQNRMITIHSYSEYADRLVDFIGRSMSGPLGDRAAASTEVEFNDLALALFQIQCRDVPLYARFAESLGVRPEKTAHWRQIPAVPTSAFKEFEMTSLAPPGRTRVFHSSGTTGQRPSRHFHNEQSLRLYESSLLPWFKRHLLPEADPVGTDQTDRIPILILTPSPVQAPHSSLVHMFATVRSVGGAAESRYGAVVNPDGAWELDVAGTLDWLERRCDAAKPALILGTAFTLVHLLDALQARRLTFALPPGSCLLETGGYKGRSRSLSKAALHEALSSALGLPAACVITEYGMSELSSQAYDQVAGATASNRFFQFPPWARVRVVSPETGWEVADGETGLIQILDLANMRSVLAVQTEDMGVRRGFRFGLLGRWPEAERRGCSLASLDSLNA